jgi:hypothetical protein
MRDYKNHGRRQSYGGSDPALLGWEATSGGSGGGAATVWVDRHLTPQSIPNNALTKVAFDTVYYDLGDFVDIATSATDLIVPTNGLYIAQAQVRWAPHATGGTRRLTTISRVSSSGFGPIGNVASNEWANMAAVGPDQNVTFVAYLAAGDILSLQGLQASGAALNLQPGGLSIARIQAL